MSDSAGMANLAYLPLAGGIPATSEAQKGVTTSAQQRHVEQMFRFSERRLEGECWYEGKDSPNDWSILHENLTHLASAELGRKAAMLLVAPHWGGDVSLQAFWKHHLLGAWIVGTSQSQLQPQTGPDLFGSMSDSALWQLNIGTAMLSAHDETCLHEALADLDTLSEAAREDDLPEPDTEALANARVLLPKLYAVLPVRYRVSPTERRGVAIDAPMRWGASVAVECAPDDTVYCFATIDGNSRRAKFYQMDGLPDVFIAKALLDLAAG